MGRRGCFIGVVVPAEKLSPLAALLVEAARAVVGLRWDGELLEGLTHPRELGATIHEILDRLPFAPRSARSTKSRVYGRIVKALLEAERREIVQIERTRRGEELRVRAIPECLARRRSQEFVFLRLPPELEMNPRTAWEVALIVRGADRHRHDKGRPPWSVRKLAERLGLSKRVILRARVTCLVDLPIRNTSRHHRPADPEQSTCRSGTVDLPIRDTAPIVTGPTAQPAHPATPHVGGDISVPAATAAGADAPDAPRALEETKVVHDETAPSSAGAVAPVLGADGEAAGGRLRLVGDEHDHDADPLLVSLLDDEDLVRLEGTARRLARDPSALIDAARGEWHFVDQRAAGCAAVGTTLALTAFGIWVSPKTVPVVRARHLRRRLALARSLLDAGFKIAEIGAAAQVVQQRSQHARRLGALLTTVLGERFEAIASEARRNLRARNLTDLVDEWLPPPTEREQAVAHGAAVIIASVAGGLAVDPLGRAREGRDREAWVELLGMSIRQLANLIPGHDLERARQVHRLALDVEGGAVPIGTAAWKLRSLTA